MKRSMLRSESGVSESLGLIFMYGVVFMSFAAIFAVMYPIYNNYIDGGHMKNMLESFDIFAYNGNNVALHNLPYASSEIKMYGGNLATRNAGYINISYYSDEAGTMPNLIDYDNRTLTILEYSKNMNKVAYIDGGVYVWGSTGSVMISEPLIYDTGDIFIYNEVPLMYSQISISGNGPVQIAFSTPYYSKSSQSVSSVNATYVSGVRHINIAIYGDYSAGISSYIKQQFGFTLTRNDEEITLSNSYPYDTYPYGIKLYIIPNYLVINAK